MGDRGRSLVLLLCLGYCFFSLGMTVVNKIILTQYHFNFPFFLLLWQNIFSFLFISIGGSVGLLNVKSLSWPIVRKWIPLNLFFLSMVVTATFSLKRLSVPMVTIFKNFQTILVAFGDLALFQQRSSRGTLISVLIMFLGSLAAGYNDLEFDGVGYFWMIVNVVVATGYVLYIKIAMGSTKLGHIDSTFYNSSLSIPMLLVCVMMTGEVPSLISSDKFQISSTFLMYFAFSGLCGFMLSLTSFWVVNTTSPTTYSIAGSLNKIPLTLLGFWYFQTPTTFFGAASIATGLLGGVVYSVSKARESPLSVSTSTKLFDKEDEKSNV